MQHILLFFILVPTYLAAQEPAGYWKGAIALPSAKLEIMVELQGKGDGWTGTIDIPMQGIRGYALSNIEVGEQRIQFKMEGIPGEPSFDGKLSDSGDMITGTFRQGPQSLNFSLQRAEKEPGDAADEAIAIHPVAGEGARGKWMATLVAGPSKLRLALHVSTQENGDLKAMLDSLDQGVKLSVDTISFEGKKLDFQIANIQGSFIGVLNADGSALEGTWAQSGQEFPLTFYRTE